MKNLNPISFALWKEKNPPMGISHLGVSFFSHLYKKILVREAHCQSQEMKHGFWIMMPILDGETILEIHYGFWNIDCEEQVGGL